MMKYIKGHFPPTIVLRIEIVLSIEICDLQLWELC